MADIGHFMIPADNVDRAKRPYSALFGGMIEPSRTPKESTPEPEVGET